MKRHRPAKEDLFAGYAPEKLGEAIATYAGTVTEGEADAWIVHVYRARAAGSRPADRPR